MSKRLVNINLLDPDIVSGGVLDDDDREVRTIRKRRKTSHHIEHQFDEYQMFEASDGELFPSVSAAKKYNSAIERKREFDSIFSIANGKMRRGQKELAESTSKASLERITDYFWAFIGIDEELNFIRNFLNKHYKVHKSLFDEATKEFKCNNWAFFVVYTKPSNMGQDILLKVVDEENIKSTIATIQQKMKELEAYLPSNGIDAVQIENKPGGQAVADFPNIDLD